MRPPVLRLYPEAVIADIFAGGGGASSGIEEALGISPTVAINHDPEAIAMHKANHPHTEHHISDVWEANPIEVTRGRQVGLLWLSPDCKHHSKAKGGKPLDRNIRALAWVAVSWAERLGPRKPKVIILENVEEFREWGPLLQNGQPCPARKGITYKRFCGRLRNLGYQVEDRELVAADYGAPTIRKRLFLVARCDGLPIVWPKPTHAKNGASGLLPWRTAAECIDWSIPCPSIFERRRPLADATQRRIARGVMKYVLANPEPFIVPLTHQGDSRVHSINDPMRTITGAHRGEYALISPTLIQTSWGERPGQKPRVPGLHKPLGTIMAGGGKHALVAAFLAQHNGTRYGVRAGRPATEPLSTITTSGKQQQLVAAFLAKHNGGHEATGQQMEIPMATVVSRDQKALVTAFLSHNYTSNTCGGNGDLRTPAKTITTGGHHALVHAFLMQYYGDGGGQLAGLDEPAHTIRSHDCLALVTVKGEQYVISDIGMRMLQPTELFKAQGFRDDYIIAPIYNGKPLTKTAQTRMCGNSVPPPDARALVRANYTEAVA